MNYVNSRLLRHGMSAMVFAACVLMVSAETYGQRRRGGPGGRGGKPPGENGQAPESKDKIKPYDEVIPEDAETTIGLFRTHVVGDDLYYEIAPDALNVDMLWVTTIDSTTAGASYAGMPVQDRVVRWEQRGERILLRDVRFAIRADTDDSISIGVQESNLAPIIKVFDVAAYGKDKSVVIKVTDLFTKDVDEFSAKSSLSAGNMDSGRSFLESVKAFPINIEVKVLATYNAASQGGDGGGRGGRFGGGGAPSGPITAKIHHSMVKLPENKMKPRVHDERVGFFSVSFVDYADDSKHEVDTVRYITRWRLEKKDPDAELSDPIKPIVFYVARETPDKWKPYVKAGIDQWQPAFEAAGFSNAIMGKYAPDPREDPDWDPEDARISSIRWLASNIPNAFGPHVSDPRTGEILEADVRMFHNVMKLVRDWYFVQASPNDERAQKLPMPDELMGELIQFVVAHEVGHSLGFPHNMKASSSYTVAQLRDPEWTKNNGTAPSIMDYARFNYVCQPGDGAALMARIGPYDHFVTEWGYRQFADDEADKTGLAEIVARQLEEPMFLYGGPNSREDSTQQSEDLTNDAVEATTLGLANLERVMEYLVEATCDEGENYDLLDNMYNAVFSQWNREMGHVISVVGGVKQVNFNYGDADRRFFPNDPDYQRAASKFLIENALKTPEKFLRDDVEWRITASGVADRVRRAQLRVLSGLISAQRLKRMAEHTEGVEGAYTPSDLLSDVRKGVFEEFTQRRTSVDVYRRGLQRGYVDLLASAMNPRPPAANSNIPAQFRRNSGGGDSDFPALARAELNAIQSLLERKRGGAEGMLAAHIDDLVARIDK
ncbi:MAG: zinc-dependent metalloprotease, partial [Planctomycetota bacterium]|nr:zinc-dependent metalloprotease [Planctomycetota bacterium]